MRIVSLLPSATEIVCALGLGDALVGVTHECDYPAEARTKPVVTSSLLDHAGASSEEIDHTVRKQLRAGLSLYEIDHALLAELAPDLNSDADALPGVQRVVQRGYPRDYKSA